jgi:hypothetical protein
MFFIGSVVLVGSLVHGLLVLFIWLRFMLWVPRGEVQPIRAFSLSGYCFFLLFSSALGLGSNGSGWRFYFFNFFPIIIVFWVSSRC